VHKKKLFIKTFGCQMNVYDSERMIDILKTLGYELSMDVAEADMVILNTCHIREKATEKVYSDLGRIRDVKEEKQRKGQQMIIAVAGCTAQAEGEEIMRRAKYVDMVFGPQSYHKLPEMLAELARKMDQQTTGPGRGVIDVGFPIESKFDALPAIAAPEGPAAFLAIQEGCDKFCHFCIVPYTRGAEYSRPAIDVLRDARALVAQGVREITLLGQNVNAYHGQATKGNKEWGLGRLCAELAEIDGLLRIRYMTSHPRDVDDELIRAHRDIPKLMPFLHLPIQSGSDNILKAMNRRHTVDDYRKIIDRFRNARPDMAFSSDFIVGYPGETDQDYIATLKLVDEMKYAQAYSFSYSIRPGTPAAMMENQVSEEAKTERLAGLQELLRTQQEAFNGSMIGKVLPVLFERKGRHEGQLIGRSPYLQSVHAHASERLIGQLIEVTIKGSSLNSLTGEIVIGEYENVPTALDKIVV
jgi:tRNA-2-methylthio-N6-dimethylallyladenosine synthase